MMNGIRLLLMAILMAAASMVCLRPAIAATGSEDDGDNRRRLAIVIGNSNYLSDRYDDLANAGNDAKNLSETLKRLNFEVATGIDLTASQFEEIFASYADHLNDFSAVLIFYAGHGVQFNGENYLLPVDALDPETVGKLTERAVKLNAVIERFASRDRQTFIFLDACRNNPLGSNAPGVGNGLAQVEVGENTFIAFATQPGNVTVDGAGSNSPFTTSLLQNVEIPSLSISDLMIRVRNSTEQLTLGRQVPWDQSNLREQFYFTEQQQLDSGELSATLSRILAEPNMKEQLLVQLASADSDLQSAVVMLGKKLPAVRAVEVGKSQGEQVASLEPANSPRGAVASDIEALLVLGKSEDGEKTATLDLNHRVQTELARVGCYRQTVDGVWGPGSRKALGDYFKRTKQQAELEPSVNLLSDLFLRSGRICRQPVAAPKQAKTATMNKQLNGTTTKAKAGARKPSRSKPAAPPPDIGAGIGIGGVF